MRPKPLRILVVDDDRETREAMIFFLAELGHWVESCPDARTALERMEYDGLDVLLTDVWLPDGGGWNYLAELSRRGLLPPRVISMSGQEEAADGPRSTVAGCYAHLVKPFKAVELEAALEVSDMTGLNAHSEVSPETSGEKFTP